MNKVVRATALALSLSAIVAGTAFAGSPHFVGTPTATVSGSTLTVTAKEAGLGDEAQINAVLTATAECINGGGNHPKAVNKETFTASSLEPVQNGQATYSLSVTANFQPSCSPPMTVVWTNATLTDTTNNLTATLF